MTDAIERDTTLIDPRRAAWGSIRGYFYQAGLTALRWLELEDDDTWLICEGDEDVDRRIRNGVGESEQIKFRAEVFSKSDLRKVVTGFVHTYVALREAGTVRRFRLTTNVPRYRWREGHEDLLAIWSEPVQREGAIDRLADGIRGLLLPTESAEAAVVWLDAGEPGDALFRWREFIGSVEWAFDSPDLDALRIQIGQRLALRSEARYLPSELLVERLICAVIDASIEPDPRQRVVDRAGLVQLLGQSARDLETWAESAPALRQRAALHLDRVLDPLTRDRGESREPSVLLRAEYQVVPFLEAGREAELEHLVEWCADPDLLKIELWTGQGGSGKTRLLVEWCRRLREQGWHAGFLREPTEADLDVLLTAGAPRLVVVDYPESHSDTVKRLLDRLDNQLHARLRVVLLARTAGSWWVNLPGPGNPRIEHLFKVVSPPSVRSLSALPSPEDIRRAHFRSAVDAFVTILGVPPDARHPDAPDDLMTDPRFDRTLYVHAAALLGLVLSKTPSAEDVLSEFLKHERSFWVRALRQQNARSDEDLQFVDRAAALITLAGGARDMDASTDLVTWALEGEDRQLQRDVQRVLHTFQGRDANTGEIEALRPDLLGEQLVDEVLRIAPDLIDMALTRCDAAQQATAVTVVSRIAARTETGRPWLSTMVRYWADRLPEIRDPMGPAIALALDITRDLDLAAAVSAACDAEGDRLSVPLREIAVVVLEAMLRGLEHEPVERARVLNNLGVRLSAVGRREEALAAAEEATGTYRELAHARPEAFLPDLAGSLSNLGNRLSEVGRREEALAAAEEATAIRRQLAQARPEAFLPDLAISLSLLGDLLAENGRDEDAFDANESAVRTLGQHFLALPQGYAPRMKYMVDDYVRSAEATGHPVDEALLAPIVEALRALDALVSDVDTPPAPTQIIP